MALEISAIAFEQQYIFDWSTQLIINKMLAS